MPSEPRPSAELEGRFLEAMECLRGGRDGRAMELLKEILNADPRLPEPHLELAILWHGQGRLDEAIEHARLAVKVLERGGQWTDDLPSHVLLAHARNLLGELLVEQSQAGETPFDHDHFAEIWNEACALFAAAYEGDPDNADARRNALLHRPEGASQV
jgi:tetratricopeptide (TPR) repeat protein